MENQENTTISLGKRILLLILAIVGFVTTIKLAIIYYDANFNPYALASFCSINEFIDCDGIAKTVDSQFLGVPLAYWGMLFYIFVVVMIFVDKLKQIKLLKFLEVFKNPFVYISALGFIAFIISMILAGVSVFQIKKLCILCLFTYFLNLFIAILAFQYSKVKFIDLFKNSTSDILAALKIKKYLITFIILIIAAVGFLSYASTSYIFAPHVKKIKSIQEYIKMKTNPYKVQGNILGDKDAKIVIDVYSDFKCPICSVYNIIIQRIATELSGVRFVHHDLPLDKSCNKYLQAGMHQGSCMLARYALAAEKQGKYWEISSAFFEQQPVLEAQAVKIAKDLGLDIKQLENDADSTEINKKLLDEIDDAFNKGYFATPIIVVDNKTHTGIIPYYELKKLLMDLGATEKN